MANNSSTTCLFISAILLFLHLLSPISSSHPLPATRDLIVEEKSRLGSTPPSCHNKCNQCHPCMAVQVPTLPSQNPVQPGLNRPGSLDHIYDSAFVGNKYTNYKPLGWKCRCRNTFYNP